MSGIARVPRGVHRSSGLSAVGMVLIMGCTVSCSNNLQASKKHAPDAGFGAAELSDLGTASNWDGLIAHNQRISPTSSWDGSMDGMKTLWFDSGAKRGEGRFVRGSKEDAWTFWYENGLKRWEGTYHKDLVQGVERSWYQNGTLCFEGTSVDGRRHGAFRAWYEDGQPWWKGEYQLGVRQGPFRYWHRDGTPDDKVSGIYVNGKRSGALGAGGLALAATKSAN